MGEAIVSIVVGRLNDLLKEEPQLLGVGSVRDEIQQVVTKLMWINTFLRDAYSRIDEHKIRTLLAEIRDVAYEAEHVVESFIVKAASTFSIGKTTPNTIKFIKKLKDIQTKMSVRSNRFNDYNIRSTLQSPESSNSSYQTPAELTRFYSYKTLEPEIFVGFHADVDLLVGHLVNESDDSYPLISICGMGGLGKTTLAEKIYNHPTIKSHFPCLAWVSISQKWQTKNVLQRILRCLVHEDKNEILTWDNDKLIKKLLQIQQQKKCLIVLDDIWSTDVWDSLKVAFPSEKSASKLMLTTRYDGVAEHVNSKGFVHRPKCLTADQSWELLEKKAALHRRDYLDFTRDVKKMEELGREMVRKCGGLPLAIVILGGILVTKPTLSEWQKVYYDSQSSLKRGEGLGEVHQKELFDQLVRGYKDLPTRLKPCFLYIGKFGEDEWVKTETLYQLWIAEGMVLPSDRREGETMMQVAESYLGELVHRNMVQVRFYQVESPLAKFEYCSLHDLMRDLSRFQAKAEDFYEIIDLQEGKDFNVNPVGGFEAGNTRQLVLSCDGYTSKESNTYVVKKLYEQQYRSILILSDHIQQGLRPILVSHVCRFKFLRVCALPNDEIDQSVTSSSTLFRMRLGRVLGSLVFLRYLSVNHTDLLFFPSIQKLVLLQTLNLEKPYFVNDSIYIPPWMSKNVLGKLQCLRHLYLPENREVKGFLGKNSKLRFDGLRKLETLVNFNTKWCEVKDLPKLSRLERLGLIVDGGNCEMEEMIKHLSALALSSSSCLKQLQLAIRCHNMRLGSGPDMLRKLMSDHKYTLQNLWLQGKIPELGEIFMDVSLLRITYLSLIDTHLEEDPMPYLEKIPTLCHLYLYCNAYVGNEMVCSVTGGFPKLIKLCLWDLPYLKKWRVEEGSMPILDTLEIRECGFQLEEEELLKEEEEEGNHLSSLASLISRVPHVNGADGLKLYNIVSHSNWFI